MPLLKMPTLKNNGAWALWRIDEEESALAVLTPEQCPEDLVSIPKRLEWLAGRITIKTLVEQMALPYPGMWKDEFGKPHLKGMQHGISLSHSYPYVAAQIHPTESVGIDLEQPKEKLLRIAGRILSPSELENAGSNVTKHCVYWCAKETMYKVYGRRALHFAKHLLLDPFTLAPAGDISGTIYAEPVQRRVSMHYQVEADFVVVYTIFNQT